MCGVGGDEEDALRFFFFYCARLNEKQVNSPSRSHTAAFTRTRRRGAESGIGGTLLLE